jgi:hypothetical protein
VTEQPPEEHPGDDPAGDGLDTEAAWRDIVDHYGERAVVGPDEYPDQPEQPRIVYARDEPDELATDLDDDWDDEDDDEEGYVPPPPPPLPRTTPARLAAWVGVLGVPVVVVVLLVTGLRVPALVGWALVAAFVGGFGFLVATMPREPRDPWDDGSRI